MSQTPPNSGWQGPVQPSNRPGQPPQGPPPGYPNTPPGYPNTPPGYPNTPPGYPNAQAFNQPQNHDQGLPPGGAPTKSKTKAIVAGAIGVVVVAAAAGVGMFLFKGSSPVAAQGLPADVSVAAEVNLAPTNAEKLALRGIAEKYPTLRPDADVEADYKKAMFGLLTRGSADAPDFDSEVAPWLGDSIAVGFQGDASDSDNLVMAIETTDRGKAEAFAKAEGDRTRVQFIDDLMIITPEGSDLSTDEIRNASLGDSELYKSDKARLGTGNLATMWFGPGLVDVLVEQAGQTGGVDTGELDTAALKGMHGAAGLQASENKLTVKLAVQVPNAPESAAADVIDLAGGLPGDALAVFAGATNAQSFEQIWSVLESGGAVEALQQLGITGATDLESLIGSQVGLSLGLSGGAPVVGAKLTTDDPVRQNEIFDHVTELLQGSGVAFSQDGNTGIVAYGQSTEAVSNPATRIGDLEGFKAAIDGKAQSVLFLNVEGFKSLPEYDQLVASLGSEATELIAPIKAVGVAGRTEADHYGEGFLHVVFD